MGATGAANAGAGVGAGGEAGPVRGAGGSEGPSPLITYSLTHQTLFSLTPVNPGSSDIFYDAGINPEGNKRYLFGVS